MRTVDVDDVFIRRRPVIEQGAARIERLANRLGWPEIAPGLFAFAVLLAVGLADGGVFPRTWRLGASALFAVAAAALLARERVALRSLELWAVGAIGAFTVWIGLSASWSGNLAQAERALLYVGALFTVLVLAERRSVPYLLAGTLAGITVVTAYGLSIYLFASPPLDPFEGALLHQPFGYANALGIFVAIGLLLAVGLASAAIRWDLRAAALAPCLVLAPALLLTSSRGAWVAFVVGLVALALLRGVRVRRTVVGLVAVAAAGATAAVVVATRGGGSLVENRLRYWDVAWADYLDHPLLGSGAGTFGDYWLSSGAGPGFTRTAHSLYVQSLAELGPVGLLLALAVVAVPLVALVRRRDPLVAVAAAAYIAYVFHTGIDWDWEMPAVTLAGLFCGAAMLVATRKHDVRPLRRRARLALAAASLALAAIALISFRTEGTSPFG
jgi:O-antigen ligase